MDDDSVQHSPSVEPDFLGYDDGRDDDRRGDDLNSVRSPRANPLTAIRTLATLEQPSAARSPTPKRTGERTLTTYEQPLVDTRSRTPNRTEVRTLATPKNPSAAPRSRTPMRTPAPKSVPRPSKAKCPPPSRPRLTSPPRGRSRSRYRYDRPQSTRGHSIHDRRNRDHNNRAPSRSRNSNRARNSNHRSPPSHKREPSRPPPPPVDMMAVRKLYRPLRGDNKGMGAF